MEITEKELSEAAGWRAWKAGRDQVKRGSISEATLKNGVYSGLMKVGGKPKRPKVTVKSKTDIITVCGCMENRRDGLLCEHGVAVVLAVLQGPVVPREEKPPVQKPAILECDQVTLLLPPIFEKLFAAGKPIPALWEKAPNGINSLTLGLPKRLSQEGGMAVIPPDVFQTILAESADRTHVLWLEKKGEPTEMKVVSQAQRLFVSAKQTSQRDMIEFSKKDEARSSKVIAGWLLSDDAAIFQKMPAAGAITPFFEKLLQGESVTLAVSEIVSELDRWDALCDFGSDLEEIGLKVSDAEIRSHIQIKGGSQALIAEASSEWIDSHGGILTGARVGALMGDSSDPLHWYRVMPGERDAGALLQENGFVKQGRSYELRGEERVMEFLAYGLNELEQTSRVELKKELTAYRGMLAPLRPEIEFSSDGSGEDWTGFDLGYRAPGSDRLSLDQVRKLLQSGRKTVKMKTGQTAVLAASDMESLEQMLKDVDPDQAGGGYRASAAQARYMQQFATTTGLGVKGKLLAADDIDLETLIPRLSGILRDYQSEGVVFLLNCLNQMGAALLADDMGLGKTLQSLAVMAALRQQGRTGPFLVVGPTSLVSTWMNEVKTFLPEWTAQAFHGSTRKDGVMAWPDLDIVVTSFALVARDLELLKNQEWAGIFVDEASIMRNPDTQSAKALCTLSGGVKVALTGTPIENGVGDVWSIFRFLMPKYLGSRKDFVERYEKPVSKGLADRTTMARLRARLAPFMLRRLKTEVAKDLPSKIVTVRGCGMTEAQSDVYHSLLKDGQQVLEEFEQNGGQARMQVLTLLLRLRQAATDPRLLGMDKLAHSGKMEHLKDLLNESLSGGHKVLVFSQFTSMLDLISEELKQQGVEYCLLTGSTRDRGAEVSKFQRTDGPSVFLISLKAGGYGLTLTEADTVIHCDPWWNPAVEAQATDRAHRIGQTRPVTVYKLITKGTVEEKILKLQEKKQLVLDNAFDDSQPVMSGLTDNDLMEVLG